jgi:hypothetical protein
MPVRLPTVVETSKSDPDVDGVLLFCFLFQRPDALALSASSAAAAMVDAITLLASAG